MSFRLLPFFLLISFSLSSQVSTVSPDDIKHLAGDWTGTLTYTDFRDDKSQSTLKCEMQAFWKRNKVKIAIGFVEPNGKTIYDKLKLKVLKGGKRLKFDGKKYQLDSFERDVESGNWELQISRRGKDNNRMAIIKQKITYQVSSLSLTKEVKYQNTNHFFVRNKYDLKRK